MGDLRRELKRAEWVLRLYEWHFPWLTELRDFEEEQSYVAGEEAMVVVGEDGEPADLAQQWLSQEEYKALPEVKRNQRALDRYLRSRKTPWQLGRDYERYIGYLRERAGARVTYQGIFAGLEDLGRDLLAEHDGVIEIIQCKRWSQHKTIHEKHVFQLFGTVVAARVEYPDRRVTGTFTTTTTLSERAHQFARQLDIRVEESVPLEDYPRIKCNVGRSGERIYHLPFDQQYDTTVISAHSREAWVSTAAEAEALGFRRAWRWRSAAAATPG
jgi:Restriction endonuclease